MRGEKVARRLNLWWIAGVNVVDNQRNYGFEINYENLELLRQLEAGTIESDGWSLRIRSDPALALRAGKAEHYWKGEFTTPINLRVSQTQGRRPACGGRRAMRWSRRRMTRQNRAVAAGDRSSDRPPQTFAFLRIGRIIPP